MKFAVRCLLQHDAVISFDGRAEAYSMLEHLSLDLQPLVPG